ncbi:MAG: transcription termination factor Rho [Armatimonadetes bacterium]|nr:transcription termination factor Rho [Candidatus Hippobium faecium]
MEQETVTEKPEITELTPDNVDSSDSPIIDLKDLDNLEFNQLKNKIKNILKLPIGIDGLDRNGVKNAVLDYAKKNAVRLRDTGIMERVEDKTQPGQYWGYLRHGNFAQSVNDIYISHSQMVRFGLKDGDIVTGLVRSPKDNEKYCSLLKVESINFIPLKDYKMRTPFEELTPIYPNKKLVLELDKKVAEENDVDNNSLKFIDIFSPVGFGTRGLIVAPPKTGKTTLLKNIAKSITINNPNVYLIILLVDERPEEVTDIERSVANLKKPDFVKVVSSTFDEEPTNHMRVSNMVLNMSKRLVESGYDVVVLLDSITRMARASNITVRSSGKLLSGGIDPASLYEPKRFIGAARNIEGGGSLTILATALVDTGSRMDDAIFEEFKATGNMELILDRSLAEKRVFPAVDVRKSGTRHDEQLFSPFEYKMIVEMERTLYNSNLANESEIIVKLMNSFDTVSDFMMNCTPEAIGKLVQELSNKEK